MRFAHLKTHHGFERMRLRGLSGARDEFHLAAIVQNLKTLALRLASATSTTSGHRLFRVHQQYRSLRAVTRPLRETIESIRWTATQQVADTLAAEHTAQVPR